MIILLKSIESLESGDLYQLTAEDNISQVLPFNSNARTRSYKSIDHDGT